MAGAGSRGSPRPRCPWLGKGRDSRTYLPVRALRVSVREAEAKTSLQARSAPSPPVCRWGRTPPQRPPRFNAQVPGPLQAHGGHFSHPLSFLQAPSDTQFARARVCAGLFPSADASAAPRTPGYKARGGLEGAALGERQLGGGSGAGPSAGTARAPGAANQRPGRAGWRGPRGAGCHRRPARAAGGKLEAPPPPLRGSPALAAPSSLQELFPAAEPETGPGRIQRKKASAQGPVSLPTSHLPLRYFFSSRKVAQGDGERAPGGTGEGGSR